MVTQTGILSYSDKFGFGYSGYYADGNALGVYMVLAVLLCIWYSFYKRNVFYFLLTFIASVGTILIGSLDDTNELAEKRSSVKLSY